MIVGTGLAALGGGLGNGMGLFNGGNTGCVMNEKQYYEDSIKNLKEFFVYAQGVSDRICALENRVSVDETAIAWQNRLIDKEFSCVDTRFNTTDVLTDYKIKSATCHCIKGNVYASPSDIADPYVGRRLVIGTYQEPYCGGLYNGCGMNTFNGCGCGC